MVFGLKVSPCDCWWHRKLANIVCAVLCMCVLRGYENREPNQFMNIRHQLNVTKANFRERLHCVIRTAFLLVTTEAVSAIPFRPQRCVTK